jgi:hypothetical protein
MEGTIRRKHRATNACVFIEGIHHSVTILNMASLPYATSLEGKVTKESLEELSLMAK